MVFEVAKFKTRGIRALVVYTYFPTCLQVRLLVI
jgi:hypothetical protein